MGRIKINKRLLFSFSILVLLVVVSSLDVGECTYDKEKEDRDRAKTLTYKITALVSILIVSAIGVCIPLMGKVVPVLSPEENIFFLVKTFAAGVIVETRFIIYHTDEKLHQ